LKGSSLINDLTPENRDNKHHFIRDHVNKKELELIFVDTKNQLADIFTKPLVEDHFNFIEEKLYIIQNPCKGLKEEESLFIRMFLKHS